MKVHRFILKVYPLKGHPEYHEWQRATLVLFVADPDPYAAEQKALNELKHRGWVPESFEHRDTLIREAVREQGGDVWDAYLEAEQHGFFWLENLDSVPMCKKDDAPWGTGPLLTEKFVDTLISDCGGHRLTPEEAGQFQDKNADYILGNHVLELKQFENEGLAVETRQRKIAGLFQRYVTDDGPVRKIDPYKLSERDFEAYCEIVGVPIQRRVKAASKQVKTTMAHMGPERYDGGVILLNTGYLTIPHDFMVAMAERYASKDTSAIKHVVVISSWTITNGFDTVVNYGFYPNEPNCPDLGKLEVVFWDTVQKLMMQMINGELDTKSGMQQPMLPKHFYHKGEVFNFGIPQIESSFK